MQKVEMLLRFLRYTAGFDALCWDATPQMLEEVEAKSCFSRQAQPLLTANGLQMVLAQMKPGNLYEVEDILGIHFFFFLFQGKSILVGPFAAEKWSADGIPEKERLANAGLSASRLLPYKLYYCSYCVLEHSLSVQIVTGAIIGTITAACKIVDAFTDFGMGRICDTAKPTPEGRFRPWIKRAAIPMGLSSMLIYQHWVGNFPETVRIVWLVVFYILWGSIFYTACNIPYGSMASVITNDPKERTQLSTWRTIGATLSGMMIGIIAPMLVFSRNDAGQQVVVPERFTITGIIFGIFAAVLYLGCYKLTTERIQIDPARASAGKEKLSVGETLKNLVTCRPLLAIIAVALLTLIASLGTQALNTYLYKDYFNDTSLMPVASFGGTLIMICMAPVATKLSAKIGKKEVGALGILIAAVAMLVLWIAKVTNPVVYIPIYLISSLGMGLNSMVTWAYIGDVIDYQEVKTGVRTDGTVYSTYSFVRKIAQAAAAGLGGFLISAIGYVSSTAGEAVVQSEATKAGLYNCMTLLPAVLYLLTFVCLFFLYPLGKKQVDENNRILSERRAKQ